MINVVVVGSGAIGLLLTNHLLKAPTLNTKLLSRKDNTTQRKFSYTHLNGLSEQSIVCNASSADIKNADLVIVCVKSYDIKAALARLSLLISPKCNILLCHNGMGIAEQLIEEGIVPTNIFTALTTHGSLKVTDNHILHSGKGHLDIGANFPLSSYQTQLPPPWFGAIKNALPPAYWHDNIIEKQWWKLAINCIINPITAINNIKNGDVAQRQYQSTVLELAKEISKVANCEGINMPVDEICNTVNSVVKNTAKNVSSMCADIRANRETEVKFINGYICELGAKHQVDTPINKLLLTKVLTLQA